MALRATAASIRSRRDRTALPALPNGRRVDRPCRGHRRALAEADRRHTVARHDADSRPPKTTGQHERAHLGARSPVRGCTSDASSLRSSTQPASRWRSPTRTREPDGSGTQLIAAGLVAEYHHPDYGRFRQFGHLLNFSETPGKLWGPPPRLGERSREVLAELGYSAAEIDELRARRGHDVAGLTAVSPVSRAVPRARARTAGRRRGQIGGSFVG